MPKITIYDKFSSFELQPGVRCSSFCSKQGDLITLPLADNVRTSWDSFLHGRQESANDRCLGWRDGPGYAWWSYDQVFQLVRKTALGFSQKTPHLSRQSFVGIYASGVAHWVVASLACQSRSLVVVPLYDTLGADARSYIINQVEMTVLFVDSTNSVGKILAEVAKTPSLKYIISFQDKIDDEQVRLAQSANLILTTFNDFCVNNNETSEATEPFDPPLAEDLFMIMYTSGTTGLPKGVMHTHRAMVADFASFDVMFRGDFCSQLKFTKNEVCLLYLPLAHAYAQLIVIWFLYHGAAIGFNSGNILKLVEDAAALKPTYMPLVPRLMNRLYSKVTSTIAESKVKTAIFWYCYRKKLALLKRGIITKSSIWDRIGFRKMQNLLGGRVWLMSVGSAPVSAEVLEFWRVCFGACVLEGYGQTETTAVASFAFDWHGGNVGHPAPCNLVKLVDVPECGYFAKDNKGEVCIKGYNVMRGYYKEPEKTSEVLDADGWLHTGDIGQFLSNGALKLIDRKKHIFKLAQGEYIAPEKIEAIYAMCPLVAQVFVDGNSLQSYTVAIVVPEPTAAAEWASKNKADATALHDNKDFAKYLLGAMIDFGKANKLNSLEQVKSIHIAAEPFSPDNGLLTPTLKNKRVELRRHFASHVEALYAAGPLLETAKE